MNSLTSVLNAYSEQESGEREIIEHKKLLKKATNIAQCYSLEPDDVIRTLDYYYYERISQQYKDNVIGKNILLIGDFVSSHALTGVILNLNNYNVRAIYNGSGRHYAALEDEAKFMKRLGYPGHEYRLTLDNEWNTMLQKNKSLSVDVVIVDNLLDYSLTSACGTDPSKIKSHWDRYSQFIRTIKNNVRENTLLFIAGPSEYKSCYDKELKQFKDAYFRDMNEQEFQKFLQLEKENLFTNAKKCNVWNYYELLARDVL